MEQNPKQKKEDEGNCAQCDSVSTKRCGHCRKVFYCSVACQKKHRKRHSFDCYPAMREPNAVYHIQTVNYYATRDIKQGEVIIEESPLYIGPMAPSNKAYKTCVCLGCNKAVSTTVVNYCKDCKWPLCRPDCEMLQYHTKAECKVFSGNKIVPWIFPLDATHYQLVRYVRALLLRDKAPTKWEQFFKMFSLRDRGCPFRDPAIVSTHFAIQFIGDRCKMNYDKHLIKMIMAIDYIFGSVRDRKTCWIVTPQIDASIQQSCVPNTLCIDAFTDKKGNKKPFETRHTIAVVDIKCGDKLTSVSGGKDQFERTLLRREMIFDDVGIWCECPRCADSTELGTYFSAIKCKKCPSGYMLPQDPLKVTSNWECRTCSFKITAEKAEKTVLQPYVDKIQLYNIANLIGLGNFTDALAPRAYSLMGQMEKFIEKYEDILHPNHALNFIIKWLISVGRLIILKDRPPTLTVDERQERLRKLTVMQDSAEYCYKISKVIGPGLSRFRAQNLLIITMGKWLQLQEYVISDELKESEKFAKECSTLYRELMELLSQLNPDDQVALCKTWIQKLTIAVKTLVRGQQNSEFLQRVLPLLTVGDPEC